MSFLCGLIVIVIAFVRYGEAACSFPSGLQNNNWTSSGFSNMEFLVSDVTFTDDTATSQTYSCHINSDSSYIIKSPVTTSFSTTVNYYYCFYLTQITTFSFSYYLTTSFDLSNIRRKTHLNTMDVTSLSEVCDISAVVAELYVLVQRDSPSSAAASCTTPLLGNFQYTTTSSTGITSCGTSPGDGLLAVCDNNSTAVVYNLTACSTQLSFSSTGILYCIATASTTVGSTETFYQILYNSASNPTYQFTCMALSYNASNSSLVYASEIHTTCQENQNATSVVTGGNLIFFQANETCVPPTASEESSDVNIALIVGLVILGLVILAIIAALLFYFCYWKNRDPNAGKPIVENTKPRFEDPDKEEILEDLEYEDTRSEPLTRDDIVFTAESPVFAAMNGHATMANGHTSDSRLSPNTAQDSGIVLSEYSKHNGKHQTPILNRDHEAMVIFNGDEKVISGNDSRVVPAENPQSFRRFQPDTDGHIGGPLTLQGLEDEGGDGQGELSNREVAYPTVPSKKSNLLPPIETIDPEKEMKIFRL